jgi:ArsR family transcriptional regulator
VSSSLVQSAGWTVGRLPRVELYRLLSDAGRLQVLALCAEEELSIGELATLLQDSQPQMSRRAQPLRQAGLLEARREGTRTLLRTNLQLEDATKILEDAIAEGRRLCQADGSLARVPSVLAAREAEGRQFFEVAQPEGQPAPAARSDGTLAHLAALAPLMPGRSLAVDVGTGEGLLLDVLAPLYSRVIAVDRSRAQLARCAQRVAERGFTHVSLFPGEYDDASLLERVNREGGADLVCAARTLHHASRPAQAIQAFTRLLKPGGHLIVLDYLPHADEAMREAQGDVWLGFSEPELLRLMESAGLEAPQAVAVPAAFHRDGPDAHLAWHAVAARKPLPSFRRPEVVGS